MSKAILPFVFGAIMSWLVCWVSLGLAFLGIRGAGGTMDTEWAAWALLAVNASVEFGIVAGGLALAFRGSALYRPLFLGSSTGAGMWAGMWAWILGLILLD